MVKFLLLLSVLSFTAITHAAESGEEATPDIGNGSEFLFQSESGKYNVTPHFQIGSTVTKYKANNQKRIDAALPLGVDLEYGINQMFSAGLNLNLVGTKSTYTCDLKPCPKDTKSAGLADPVLEFKGRSAVWKGTLKYGAELALSVQKAKTDSSGDSNAAAGGTTLTPFVGYEMLLGPGFIGARLSYDLYKADRKRTDDFSGAPSSTETTESNGHNLSATVFYEAKVHKVTYGAALTQTLREESRTSTNGAKSVPNRDQGNTTNINVYVPVQLTETIALLPAANFTAIAYSNSGTIDVGAAYGITVGARFTF